MAQLIDNYFTKFRLTSRVIMENDNKWECSVCTFLNNLGTQRCEMCESRRPAMGGGGRVSSSSSSSSSNGGEEGGNIFGNRISQGLLLGAIGAGGLALFRGSSLSDVIREALNGATVGALAGNIIEQTSSISDYDRVQERERERRRLRSEEEAEMFRRLENLMLTQRVMRRREPYTTTRFNINDAFLQDMIQGMYQNMSPRELHQLIHERYTRSGRREIPTDEVDNMSYEELVERYPQNPIPAPASVVNNLTEYKYSNTKKSEDSKDDEYEECSVCLGKFVEEESLKLLPCSHKFHKECIETWLSRSGMCPICKYRVGN